MPDLTPEERQRIYQEEKARLEVRRELEGKKTGVGKIIGIIALCGVAILVVLLAIGSSIQKAHDDSQTGDANHEKCKALVAAYHLPLERTVEVELNSIDLQRDRYKAVFSLHVSLTSSNGRVLDPAVVVDDVISQLTHVGNADDRRRLEYVLLGSAMPLEARRQFEEYCVGAKP